MDLEALLPDDVLAGILRCLAPRYLAASRCVCKAWCRVVDTHHLLHADLLPLSLGGIFFNYQDLWFTQFLSRPTTGVVVSGRLDYTVPGNSDFMPRIYVKDHCNGLLVLDRCVVNPATQQWALLPPCPPLPLPPGIEDASTNDYLVFDPTLSPNYELFLVPNIPFNLNGSEEFEWPPPTLILSVFSSKTGCWEEREFSRDGVISRILPGVVGPVRFENHQCGYWREALYVCCNDNFVMRISLSDNKYQVIRLITEDGGPTEQRELYLGKSVRGIYFASFFHKSHLQVWFLNDQIEWVLKHDRDISPILPNLDKYKRQGGPWILHEFNYWEDDTQYSDEVVDSEEEDNHESTVDEAFEWDSDNDNVLEPAGSRSNVGYIEFFAFHPFKEVVFLQSDKFGRVLAYNWSTSKLQYLGKVFPKFYTDIGRRGFYHNSIVIASFPYSPCWMGELPEKLN